MTPHIDYRTPEDLRRTARAKQKRLAAALPEPLRSTPRWKLVQDKHIPSIKELEAGLLGDNA